MMHGPEKSDPGIVAMKPANKTAPPLVAKSREVRRAPRAIVSRSRSRVAIRAPTELGFAAALRACRGRLERSTSFIQRLLRS
jgi:hypothetical protein